MGDSTAESSQKLKVDECPQAKSSEVTSHVIRLLPGMPLKQSLIEFCQRNALHSAYIITCVGSLTKVSIRMANSHTVKKYAGHFEIVSLVGTVSGGDGHLHISISDSDGNVMGGHLMGDDCIYTTAEVVLGDLGASVTFGRTVCPQSGWPELTFT